MTQDDDLLYETPRTGPPRRVLVVDDDIHAVRILEDFLESRGFMTVSAADGHEALARFHDDGPFDVIALDVMMPGIDGLEVCRRVKATPQGQLTPVLLISARSDTRSRIAGLYGGADDYMSKPVDLREAEARIGALIRVRDRYLELAEGRKEGIDAALSDGLSGLANQQYFMRRLEQEIARCDRYNLPLTVVVADLDGLPEPEGDRESGGTPEGSATGPTDRLVAQVGQTLRTHCRRVDLVARLRRSRFALMLPHTSRRSVDELVARLRAVVAAVPLDPDGGVPEPAGLELRVGVAELGARMDAVTLVARAEPD